MIRNVFKKVRFDKNKKATNKNVVFDYGVTASRDSYNTYHSLI